MRSGHAPNSDGPPAQLPQIVHVRNRAIPWSWPYASSGTAGGPVTFSYCRRRGGPVGLHSGAPVYGWSARGNAGNRRALVWRAPVKRFVVSAAVVSWVVLSGAAPASASTPAWRVQFPPKPPNTSTFLQGVSCPARGNCTAAGFATSSGNPSTLAEHWDGTRWTIQTTPNPAGPPGEAQAGFSGVSCASLASCTAVGDYFTTSGYQPLAEQWDGTSWTIQTVPIPAGAQGGELASASCISPTSCTAVGFYVMTGGENLPLAEHWDGTSWAVQAVPVPSGGGELLGVSCPTDLD